jgi:hypothetical protein
MNPLDGDLTGQKVIESRKTIAGRGGNIVDLLPASDCSIADKKLIHARARLCLVRLILWAPPNTCM